MTNDMLAVSLRDGLQGIRDELKDIRSDFQAFEHRLTTLEVKTSAKNGNSNGKWDLKTILLAFAAIIGLGTGTGGVLLGNSTPAPVKAPEAPPAWVFDLIKTLQHKP